jgi:excisionase family DNA binding protein
VTRRVADDTGKGVYCGFHKPLSSERCPMLSAKQAAEKLGVSDSLVYAWCASGALPHFRMGRAGRRGRILIAEADLDAFLATRKEQRGGGKAESLALKHIKMG